MTPNAGISANRTIVTFARHHGGMLPIVALLIVLHAPMDGACHHGTVCHGSNRGISGRMLPVPHYPGPSVPTITAPSSEYPWPHSAAAGLSNVMGTAHQKGH